ncbi:MAG: hypothetical protein HY820_38375 [Acidobacteria bacterium]|nr:hypothetical protein [Acidobacteriota bacterium]
MIGIRSPIRKLRFSVLNWKCKSGGFDAKSRACRVAKSGFRVATHTAITANPNTAIPHQSSFIADFPTT